MRQQPGMPERRPNGADGAARLARTTGGTPRMHAQFVSETRSDGNWRHLKRRLYVRREIYFMKVAYKICIYLFNTFENQE